MTIRRGTPNDRAFVIDLGRRVAPLSVASLRTAPAQSIERAYEHLVDLVFHRYSDLIVAEVNGQPAGFALVLHDMPDEITLTDQSFVAYMAVEPTHQRSGIGRALLEHVEALARRLGLPYLSLMVTEDNAAARGLYEGAGFVTERRMMTKALS